MIKLLRVDERLIHGQVAFAWTNSLKADCILIVNDAVAADKLRSTCITTVCILADVEKLLLCNSWKLGRKTD